MHSRAEREREREPGRNSIFLIRHSAYPPLAGINQEIRQNREWFLRTSFLSHRPAIFRLSSSTSLEEGKKKKKVRGSSPCYRSTAAAGIQSPASAKWNLHPLVMWWRIRVHHSSWPLICFVTQTWSATHSVASFLWRRRVDGLSLSNLELRQNNYWANWFLQRWILRWLATALKWGGANGWEVGNAHESLFYVSKFHFVFH